MGRYINKKHECEFCGEIARRPRHEEVPECWHDGGKIEPKWDSRGIICADCQWFNFEEFCHSQGVSPHNPVKYF